MDPLPLLFILIAHYMHTQHDKSMRKDMLQTLKTLQQLDELACMKSYVTDVLNMSPQTLAPWFGVSYSANTSKATAVNVLTHPANGLTITIESTTETAVLL